MAVSLFPHNQTAYDAAVAMLSETGKAAIVHPTGTGKSFIAFKLCEENSNKCICWLSPSEYIFKTQQENLAATGADIPQNIIFYTYAKLVLLSEAELSEIRPDYIILDEFHRCGAEIWGQGVARLLSMYAKVPVLGLSATNIRYLDNQRDMADELFGGNIASEMTLGEAIVRGILNPPTYITSIYSYQKDYEKLKSRARRAKSKAVRDEAEKILEKLHRALENAEGLDVIFQKHIKDKTGKYLVFCTNMEHLEKMRVHVGTWFGGIDKNPHIYTAYADDPATDKAFAEFKSDNSDHLKLLFCIDMLNEGVHVEDVSGVILFRPTVSPIVYKQQIGRALSASKSKEPVIFDIVNNIENLYSIGTIQKEMGDAVAYYRSLGESGNIVTEQFRLIDEIRDAKELFEELNETLTASWDLMYMKAVEYAKVNGNLEVPRRYKTKDGYSLGNWIFTQRKVKAGVQYGNLSQARIKKLEQIGMVWDSVRDTSWQRYFTALMEYRKEHGNLDVKANYVSPSGIKLGSWLSNLRTYRKNNIQSPYLTQERIESLERLGMVWDVPDYLWERNYAACVEYHRTHGDLDIPFDYVTKEGLKLGAWIRNQRSARQGKGRSARLNEEQIRRLDGIGMMWGTKYDRAWETGYTEAKAYVEAHKTLDVPTTYITASGYKLGRWIANQRAKGKEKLSLTRQKRLDAIGMIWEKQNSWETRYKLAAEYFAEHGNLRVPSQYKADGVWLNKWLNEQRQIHLGKRKGKRLSEEQICRLESVGMTWDVRDSQAWREQMDEASAFYKDNGNLDVPMGYVSPNGKRLDLWISRQRKQRQNGNLTTEQIADLDALGMVWTVADSWVVGYEYAKAFFDAKGHLAVPANYRCEDGYLLGRWIANQRSAYKGLGHHRKLSKERIHRLEAIGMVWQINRRKETEPKAVREKLEIGKFSVPSIPIPKNLHWNSEALATSL